MDQPALPLAIAAPPQRRPGRPKGSSNKRSTDLARWIEHEFAGRTPGQQSAELALVRPKDLKTARADAKELRIVDLDLPLPMLALVVRAEKLARGLGCSRAEAWALMVRERAELMAYVHQKQPAAAPKDAAQLPTVFLIPEGVAQQDLVEMGDADEIEVIEHSPDGPA